jgi:hypothetical protein
VGGGGQEGREPDINLPHSLAAPPPGQCQKPRNGLNKRADARTRTGDPFITSEVLYQLSYVGARLV